MLTDELDSQPTPPTPDPTDVGENKKHSQIATPDDTQPTPPSRETLNRIPQHLRDNVVRSQDSGEVQQETFANHNTTPTDSFLGSNKKNRLSRSKKKGVQDKRCSSAPETSQPTPSSSVVLERMQVDVDDCVFMSQESDNPSGDFLTPRRPSRLSRSKKKRGILNVSSSSDTSQDLPTPKSPLSEQENGNEKRLLLQKQSHNKVAKYHHFSDQDETPGTSTKTNQNVLQQRKIKEANLPEISQSSESDEEGLPSPLYVPLFRSPSPSVLPSTSAATTLAQKKTPMTPAEKQRAYRARKALERRASSQSDTDELPSPSYVPLVRSSSEVTQKKKPLTAAERMKKYRAAQTEKKTQQRLKDDRLRHATAREAETEEETQERLEEQQIRTTANRAAETEEETQERLEELRIRNTASRAAETEDETQERLEEQRIRTSENRTRADRV